MTKRKTLLFDCDGPIARFGQGFLDVLEEITGVAFGEAVITDWTITAAPFFAQAARDCGMETAALKAKVWKRVTRIGFCSNLRPVEGAKDAIRQIREFADVEVLTSPLDSSPTWVPERLEWLGRHFDFVPGDVHLISKKYRVHGDLLLDDKGSHIQSWADAEHIANVEGRALLWDAPYNRREESHAQAIRVSSWPEVLAFAKGFCEVP